MTSIPTRDSDRLEYRQPAGWGLLFTIPLFLALAAWFAFWILSPHGLFEGAARDPVAATVCLAVAGWLGWLLVRFGADEFWRIGVSIDRTRGTATVRGGVLVPIAGETAPLSACCRLRLGVERLRRGRHIELRYVLDLSGDRSLRIGRSGDLAPVRRMAETIGVFLGLDLVDATVDPEVAVPADRLGKPLARFEGVAPDPPPDAVARAEIRGDRTVIRLPVAGAGCAAFFASLAVVVAAFFALVVAPIVPIPGLLFLGGLAAVVLAILSWAFAPERVEIEAGPAGLAIETRGWFLTSCERIPRADLREIHAVEHGFEVVSAGGRTKVAHRDIGPAEAAWIRSALQVALR